MIKLYKGFVYESFMLEIRIWVWCLCCICVWNTPWCF